MTADEYQATLTELSYYQLLSGVAGATREYDARFAAFLESADTCERLAQMDGLTEEDKAEMAGHRAAADEQRNLVAAMAAEIALRVTEGRYPHDRAGRG